MKRLLKAFITAMAVMLAVTLIIPAAACTPVGDQTIRVISKGGLALEGVIVTLLRDGNETGSAETDENGEIKVNLEGNVSATLSSLPDGYKPESVYRLDSSKQVNTIVVESSIITDKEKPANKRYRIGDVIYDFELPSAYNFSDATGATLPSKKIRLSELFKGKKVIILKFFFVNCSPCNSEIPAMKTALADYADSAVILGLDNQGDSDADVANFVIKHEAPYYMSVDTIGLIGSCEPAVTNFPTNLVIDRYGVICERFTGGETNPSAWRQLFQKYVRDDYSQNITDDNNFVADKPADFGVSFSDAGMNEAINNTGENITFSAIAPEVDDSIWPFALSEDRKSVYATNKGHYATRALLNVQVYFPKNTDESNTSRVLAFDYTISGLAGTDYFYVAVDSNGGLGSQTLEDSGEATRVGYAYVALEPGWHTITFAYYKRSTESALNGLNLEDTVRISNLRFVSVEEFEKNSDPVDFPYYAARGEAMGGYENYENVELQEDGYYHVLNRRSKQGDDPILYALMIDAAPFFPDVTHQATITTTYFLQDKCTFQGTDYKNLLGSYCTWATNSGVSRLVPVTEPLKQMLTDIYLDQYDKNKEDYAHPDNGWLEFCTFFVHYGSGDSMGPGIDGLTAFTALEAKETTGKTELKDLNKATFNRIHMPRGMMYEFIPEDTGVYEFSGIHHIDEKTGKAIVFGKDAWLMDGDSFETDFGFGQLDYTQVKQINESGNDYIQRKDFVNDPLFNYDEINFKMYHYLEKGHKYYLMVAFSNTDLLGDLYFRIDRINDDNGTIKQEHKYITSATGGFLIPESIESNKYKLPVFTEATLENGYYVSTNAIKSLIYCDFTDASRLFNINSIATLLAKEDKKPFDFTSGKDRYGNDLTDKDIFGRPITSGSTHFEKQDYTDKMKEYCRKSTEGKQKTDELYGLLPVDETLRQILIQFYTVNVGFDDDNEWLKACYYFDYTSAQKPLSDVISYYNSRNI